MPPAVDASAGRRVAVAGIAASAALAATNLTVGVMARSTSVFATGIEFAGDVLASTVVLLGMLAAAKPADDNHPYGHGRVETLAAFVVGCVLTLGGVGISWTSLQAVADVHPAPSSGAILALVLAITVRALMSGMKFRIGRQLRSAALVADAWNDAVDILSAGAALTAVTLAMFDPHRFRAADHYGGFVVGIVVIVTGLRVLREASLELVDTMPPAALIARLREAARGVPEVRGVDKVFARKTGFRYHVDLHIEVAPGMTVAEAHGVAGHVRRRIRAELDWVADVLVHVEPADNQKAAASDPVSRVSDTLTKSGANLATNPDSGH
jgi:cation diffusion facilitator family transporter